MQYDNETRLIDLTVGQLVEIITRASGAPKPVAEPEPVKERRLVYGIAGIAQLFGCSMTTANRIKQSGKIDQAIKQRGRLIVVDADLAMELFGNINSNH